MEDIYEKYIQLETPRYKLKVNKNTYNIDIGISFERMEKYFEDCSKKSYKEAYYNMFFYDIELDEKMLTQEQKSGFLNAVLEENQLKKFYNEIDNKDIYERFNIALKKQRDVFKFRNRKIPNPIQIFVETYFKQITQIVNSETIRNIYKSADSVVEVIRKAIVFYKSDIDEQQLKKMELGYEKWAKYGWTSVPSGPVFLFFKVDAIDQNTADEICLKYLKNDIGRILTTINGKIKNNSNYSEAIECFKLEYYTATAMIITSIIEREIMELIMDKDGRKPRMKMIAQKYKEKYLENKDELLNYYLMIVNLSKFLEQFFEYGNDFIEQIDYLNRNFLMHGWRDVKINKIDCIKLFLCLYNIVFLKSDNV